jgi:hypothetical protein
MPLSGTRLSRSRRPARTMLPAPKRWAQDPERGRCCASRRHRRQGAQCITVNPEPHAGHEFQKRSGTGWRRAARLPTRRDRGASGRHRPRYRPGVACPGVVKTPMRGIEHGDSHDDHNPHFHDSIRCSTRYFVTFPVPRHGLTLGSQRRTLAQNSLYSSPNLAWRVGSS